MVEAFYKLKVGYRLPTRDGRHYSNAVVRSLKGEDVELITDFGNCVTRKASEIPKLFHEPFEYGEDCQEIPLLDTLKQSLDLKFELVMEVENEK